jgi:hypothetical protein
MYTIPPAPLSQSLVKLGFRSCSLAGELAGAARAVLPAANDNELKLLLWSWPRAAGGRRTRASWTRTRR